jgi:hypothetical protein
MPAFLLGFLTDPLKSFLTFATVALGILTGVLYVEHLHSQIDLAGKDAKIASLTVETASLNSSIENLNLEIGLAKKAQTVLEQSINDANDRAAKNAILLGNINHAADGSVSPALRAAFGPDITPATVGGMQLHSLHRGATAPAKGS